MYATMRFTRREGPLDPGAAVPHRARPADAARSTRLVLRHDRRRRRPLRGRPGRDAGDDRPPHRDLRALARGRVPALQPRRRPEDLRDRRRGPVRRQRRAAGVDLPGGLRARPGGRAWRSGRRTRRPGPRPGASPRPRPSGCSAGAKATNQAVVFFGSWAMSAVETSSAVPVLPATVTPGIAAALPVPPLDDGDHHVAHLAGDLRADRALARALACPPTCGLDAHAAVGDRRRRPRPSRAGWRGRCSGRSRSRRPRARP